MGALLAAPDASQHGTMMAIKKVPIIGVLGLCLFAGLILSCRSKEQDSLEPIRLPVATPVEHKNIDAQVAFLTDPKDPIPAVLTNGIVGVRIARDGSYGKADAMLPFFTMDSYSEADGESLRETVAPASFEILLDGKPFGPEGSKNYRQAVDLKSNQLTTRWESGSTKVDLQHSLKGSSVLCRATINAPDGVAVEIRPLLGKPEASPPNYNLVVGKPSTSSSNGITLHEYSVALQGPPTILPELKSRPDIELEGPAEDQQAIRALLWSVTNTVPPKDSKVTISPFGLTDATYRGHVFWDADTWVFPAVCLLAPEKAAAIASYRLQKNRPPVPWESSMTGKDVNTGPMAKELHITGDVTWMLSQASALGLADEGQVQTFGKQAADYWLKVSVNGQDGVREIKGVIGPDEFATVDNNLYTNLLAEWTVQSFSASKSIKFKRPRDSQSLLTRDGDKVKNYKQADVVLCAYPLQEPEAEGQTAKLLDRFTGKFSKNVPMMTDSVHALLYARIGDRDRAYELWKKEIKDGLQWHPLLQFREKRSMQKGIFVTGAGGCLQTVLYGFAGLRIDRQEAKNAKWKVPLKGGLILSCAPNLPTKWTSLTLQGVKVLGKTYRLKISNTAVQATETS